MASLPVSDLGSLDVSLAESAARAAVVPMAEAVSPWGELLAVYFVLVGVPSGLTLTALAVRAWLPESGERLQRQAALVSLATLAVLALLLVIDLGRPLRFFLMLTRFDNLASPISLGAKLIAVKAALLVVALYLHRLKRRAGDGAVPADRRTALIDTGVRWSLGVVSLALALYPVSVLARSWVSPAADTSGAALVYLVTTLLLGAAVLWPLLRSTARDVWRHGMLALLLAYAVAVVFEAVSVTDPAITSSAPGAGGWALLTGGGLVVPWAGLLAAPRNPVVQGGCALLAFAGATVGRYLIFAIGP